MIKYQKYFKIITYLVISQSFYSFADETNSVDELIIQSTTSTRDSGFYDYIIPKFNEKYSIIVKVIAVGTGQAINNARNCDGDILIVHSKEEEMNFIDSGHGTNRETLMYNDFIIIGPKSDPLNLSSLYDPAIVFGKLSNGHKFISRGDDSGTHRAEIKTWEKFDYNPDEFSQQFYYETGQGMGATLNIAIGLNAYTFTDRATWIHFKNKANHKIVFQNNRLLSNEYGIILVNPEHCPDINLASAKLFQEWILSDNGRMLINNYKIDNKQLFYAE
tara:strand:+ start:463 stop:1287 length:825 start_codon:yes stop_codon:yes gene_type:complete